MEKKEKRLKYYLIFLILLLLMTVYSSFILKLNLYETRKNFEKYKDGVLDKKREESNFAELIEGFTISENVISFDDKLKYKMELNVEKIDGFMIFVINSNSCITCITMQDKN